MAISTLENSLKNRLNAANPNTVSDAFRNLKVGDMLRGMKCALRKKVPAANSGNLATVQAIALPDDAKACSVIRAYSRAGTVTGELTAVAYGVTPATGQFAVAPNGNIVVLAADAITSMDVVYEPEIYDTLEFTLNVTSNVATLPAAATTPGVVMLLEAEATTGTSTGNKIVLVPGGSPSAGQAALNVAKGTVTFAGADAVTKCRVKLAVASAVNVDSLLESASSTQ